MRKQFRDSLYKLSPLYPLEQAEKRQKSLRKLFSLSQYPDLLFLGVLFFLRLYTNQGNSLVFECFQPFFSVLFLFGWVVFRVGRLPLNWMGHF